MQSKITIEVDFDLNNEPCLQILFRSSDDIRDKLIKNFIEKLSHVSSWCKVYLDADFHSEQPNGGFQRWKIKPIPVDKLKEQGDIMLEQDRLCKESINNNFGFTEAAS